MQLQVQAQVGLWLQWLRRGYLLTEIPLFHVLNARITFSNLCGCDEPLSSVWVPAPGSAVAASGTTVEEGATRLAAIWVLGSECGPSATPGSPFPCEVDPAVFEVPEGYSVLGAERSEPLRDEDDDLLQFAIQQSLLEAGTEAEQVGRRQGWALGVGRGGRGDSSGLWLLQVTVWEALTNTRPGTHPPPQATAYEEQLQLER